MTEEILVEISPEGKVTMDAKGFHGKQCEVVMSEIEQALGEVSTVRLKPEYHEKVAHGERITGR